MGEELLPVHSSLLTPVTIAEDEVELVTFNIQVVFKPIQEMKLTPLLNHASSREDKHFGALGIGTCSIWQPDRWEGLDKTDPLQACKRDG